MSWKQKAINSIKSYDEDVAIKAAMLSEQIYTNVKPKNSIFQSKVNSLLFMDIILDNKTVFVVFRGTVNKQNLKTNINIRFADVEEKVKIHLGFYKRYERIAEELFSVLEKYKKKSVVCCGHSMGAAVASIAAFKLAQSKFKVKLFTFGSPQVGNIHFKDMMTNLVPLSWRFVNSNDMVVRSVPRNSYHHIGILMMIKPQIDSSINAHKMKAYVSGIQSKKYDMSRYTICKSKQ